MTSWLCAFIMTWWWDDWQVDHMIGMCGNQISVRFRFSKPVPNRTEAKRSNPKFQFPWLFSKPNLSHSNSQYFSHSHKAVTFFTLWTLSDSKWSWNLRLEKLSTKMQNAHTRKTVCTFFCILFYKWSTEKTEANPRFFSKPNWNRTELEKSILHIPTIWRADHVMSWLIARPGREDYSTKWNKLVQ